MSVKAPEFAVVGRMNKGKSSIVSTFIESEAVAVDAKPGTTKECARFELRDDRRQTLCVIHDTPGFEDAPAALEWLREQEGSVAERGAAVERFVDTFQEQDRFKDECNLLRPILDGASILYVVDGAVPYRNSYEAEMEILQWTGRPRMALINRIGPGDHTEEWRRALDQYFSIVRVFDAHGSGFEERVGLLRAFRELSEDGRPAIDASIEQLERDWKDRRRKTAGFIADLLVDSLSFTIEERMESGDSLEARRTAWRKRFQDELRRFEKRERAEIESLYRHESTERREDELAREAIEEDLFTGSRRKVLGLTSWQLARAGAVAGAAVGGTIDVATGGSTFLLGTAIGGVLGGLTTYYGGQSLADVKIVGRPLGGDVVRVGPVGDPNFPWVLLDRAILHYETVLDRAHAQRDVMVVAADGEKQGLSTSLSSALQGRLSKLFAKIGKSARRDGAEVDFELRDEIKSELSGILDERYG